MNQAKKVLSQTNLNQKEQSKILNKIQQKIKDFDMNSSPPDFALFFYNEIQMSAGSDFYDEIKKEDNKRASICAIQAANHIINSQDPLKTLIRLSICANIMDFAANPNHDIDKSIELMLDSDFAIDDYQRLKSSLQTAKSILYIADNCGEIIFDKLVLEHLSNNTDAKITLLVRSEKIINDVTMDDAKALDIDKIKNLKILNTPGVFPFYKKSKELHTLLKDSDVVISKGQANYECLSDVDANIFFLLIAKCDVIAKDIGVNKSDHILMAKK
jgi:damage-control phosphatase, subfamily I